MIRWIPVLALLVASCGSAFPTSTASQPRTASEPRVVGTPAPYSSPTPSNVLAIVTTADGRLRLMSPNGTIVASTQVDPAPFRPNTAVSWTSATRTRVYYLYAGYVIRYLAPDGSTEPVRLLSVSPNEQAGISVSPDNKRVAVAILSYDRTTTPATYKGMRLYVEDLQDGAHHVDIFSSPTVAEFPIGWVNGQLVLAVSKPVCCPPGTLNPYGASEIHVANPDTGDRLKSFCGASYIPEGPVETFGLMCTENGAIFWSWDGTKVAPPAAVPYPGDHLNAVSPDGNRVAIGQNGNLFVWGPAGASPWYPLPATVYGWLDNTRIVIRLDGYQSLSVFDQPSKSVTDLFDAATYLGVFPAALS